MPDQNNDEDKAQQEQGIKVNIDDGDIQPRLSQDTQRFFTDADPIEQDLLFAFCGYRVEFINKVNKANQMLMGDNAKEEQIKRYYVDKKARIMNAFFAFLPFKH